MADSNVTNVLDDCGCEAVGNASDANVVSGLRKRTYLKKNLNGLVDSNSVYLVDGDDALDAGGNRIVNVGSPVAKMDAATKKYVDETLACKLACSAGLSRDNKKRLDFLEPSYNNLAKRFQYLDKKYFYLVDRYNEFQGEIHTHSNKEDVLDLLIPEHVRLLGGKEGEVTYHLGDGKTTYFKKIMNLAVHVVTDLDELEECKRVCMTTHDLNEGHSIVYYNTSTTPPTVQIWKLNAGNWSLKAASYMSTQAAYNDICDTIGVGRYTYNTISGRFFWCESRQVPLKELDFNAFYIGKTPPQNNSLLWLYPDEDIEKQDVTRLDNLQYQIYKLGLQIRDLSRVIDVGCVPGDVDCNYKNEIIKYGEMLQPDEITNYDELVGVRVYGPSNVKNMSKFYCLFAPSSFNYEDTGLKWSFVDCDKTNTGADIPHQKTLSTRYYPDKTNEPENYTDYKLRCRLVRANEDATQPINSSNYGTGNSHLCWQIKYSVLNSSGNDIWNQSDIDEAIEKILLDDTTTGSGLKAYQLQLQIDTDKLDEYDEQVVGTSPVVSIAKGEIAEDEPTSFRAVITGDDYCDDGSNYHVEFNENVDGVVDTKLHSSCRWYFMGENSTKTNYIYQYEQIEDPVTGNVTTTNKITHRIEILNPLTPVATISITMTDGYYLKDLDATKIELFVESTIDNTIFAKKQIEVGGIKPNTKSVEPTVHSVCAKLDTATNFQSYQNTLYDGELLYYTDQKKFVVYYGGQFRVITGSGAATGGGTSGISLEDLLKLKLPYLNFKHENNYYRLYVNDKGYVRTLPFDDEQKAVDDTKDMASWGIHINHLLGINSFYCGGTGSNYTKPCSHNYVELVNGADYDINLNGMYLMYTHEQQSGTTSDVCKWETLKLQGIVKAGGSFLIRGACCNPEKDAFIKVDTYDMEWKLKTDNDYEYDENEVDYERTGELISFAQDRCTFYLVQGFDGVKYLKTNKTPRQGEIPTGYIDLVGVKKSTISDADVPAETSLTYDSANNKWKAGKVWNVDEDWTNLIFYRWFSLDPSKQANKKYIERNNSTLWTYINLNKQTRKQGNNIQYYYSDELKRKFTPKASYENKDFFTNKTTFRSDVPNMINLTFGRQATETMTGTVGNSDAARCLNWVSVGYYDEYVEYKKKTDSEWTRVYSITADDNDQYINSFHQFYDRFRWTAADGTLVTTHKVLIHGLSAGEYEYRVGRDDSPNYISDTLTFKVRNNNQVKSFSFVQTTDQQGFNWLEYQAWARSCDMIAKTEVGNTGALNIDFTINTGDITQSGNRPNEWLDYYVGRKSLRGIEEMYTVGNNDLCGIISSRLTDGEDATSKFNQINSFRYYTYELDPNNASNYFCTHNGVTYPIYSLYSYNYGAYHFVCLNSEVSKNYGLAYGSSDETANTNLTKAINATIESWFTKDLQLFKGIVNESELPTDCQKCIVYMHEMPFTILTNDVMKQSTERKNGCKLNDFNNNGKFRFSRLFKKYGIRLVMGGHKHTFCITKPIFDAPANYLNADNTGNPDNLFNSTNDITTEMSIKPVIQVLSANDIPTEEAYTKYARYELVNKITAPTYVMCQATGYKLVSNKELPAFDWDIPWMLSYFKTTGSGSTANENVRQHRPMYIRYDLTDSDIVLTVKQVDNIWVTTSTAKTYNINNQKSDLYVVPMTFGHLAANTNIPSGYVSDYYNPTVCVKKNASSTDWNATASAMNVNASSFKNANNVEYSGVTSYKLDTTV